LRFKEVRVKTMAHDLGTHSTKLSVLFVAAILIPGCFLAYFSIQNIGSQKELAEKRLLEEEERLATQIGVFLRDELLRSATAFFAAADKVYPDLQDTVLPSDVGFYVAQAFALDKAGGFLWPRYSGVDPASISAPESVRFLTSFSGAERAEFTLKNLNEAARLYREAAGAARQEAKRAAAINGLARVLAKSSQTEQAVAQYEVLLERYGSLDDENGLSFARYALHQLMRISSSDPTAVLRRISTLLARFESGENPLGDQTESLLLDVEEWMKRDPKIAAANDRIPGQISLLRSRLVLVAHDARGIDFFQSKDPGSVPLRELGPFGTVAGQVAGSPRLFVIRQDANRSEILGFQVGLEMVRSALLDRASHIPTTFELEVTIVSGGDIHPAGNSVTMVRDLSPLLPWWRVGVRPKDPEIISRYVSRRRWIYGTTLALLVAGMVLGVVLVLRDLSREQRLSQLRTDFVANVTHELKTPLTSIRMFAEILRMRRTKNEAEQQECLDVIVGETQRLSRLINTVLDFSNIERGQKQYRMAEVDVSEVAQSALNTLKYSLEEQGFALEAEIEPRVRAIGDADALEQAMLNLIDNAVKYSHRKKSVQIGLWTMDDRVFFRVADRGIGIPAGDQNRIFEKFYRAHAGNERNTGGAGLGLTVVKHIVEAHQGKIELESNVGEGSSFTIILPKFQEGALGEPSGNDNDPRD
jgi:signal transduction histidine kinase